MITLYKSDGTKEDHSDQEPTLEWMQKKVGGYIEVIHLDPDTSIVCNEDGGPMELPLAHPEVNAAYKKCWAYGKDLVGDCLIISSPHKIS